MSGKKDKIKDSERFSIISDLTKCYVCGTDKNIHVHEIFGGQNRAKSKSDGMCLGLCGPHHNLSSQGIHYNKALDDKVKKQAEKIWIKTYCDKDLTPEEKIEQFIKRYGQNYLNEEDLW